jgi:hypothetical protein
MIGLAFSRSCCDRSSAAEAMAANETMKGREIEDKVK